MVWPLGKRFGLPRRPSTPAPACSLDGAHACRRMLTAATVPIYPRGTEHTCLSPGERMNRLCSVHRSGQCKTWFKGRSSGSMQGVGDSPKQDAAGCTVSGSTHVASRNMRDLGHRDPARGLRGEGAGGEGRRRAGGDSGAAWKYSASGNDHQGSFITVCLSTCTDQTD